LCIECGSARQELVTLPIRLDRQGIAGARCLRREIDVYRWNGKGFVEKL
jgi:hypothetical protein